jgi:protein-disulfide isomerase
MRRYLPFIIVIAVAILTISGGAWLYRTKLPVKPVAAKNRPAEPAGPEEHAIGPADATVTLEEYGDYQCPPCGALSEPLHQIARDFPKLRVVFKNFPLVMHQHANEAALAAEAAGLQGHFWPMHDLLYHEQATWSKSLDVQPLFNAYAAMLKCNVDRFKKDMASEPVISRVKADQQGGAKVGVTNTPTIFINNTVVPPASLNPKDLRDAVETAMKESEPKPAVIK